MKFVILCYFCFSWFIQSTKAKVVTISDTSFSIVIRHSDTLLENGKVFRFIGLNTPDLHIQEDDAYHLKGWHRTSEYEIRDAFETIRQMGGTVTRIYVFSVKGGINNLPNLSHILSPGVYNDSLFRDFDLVLKLANEYRIRLIIPFIDNWNWWGGTTQFAGFRGKLQKEFCSDSTIRSDYKAFVHYVVNRVNTLTGISYKKDPCILAWETGNELGKENANDQVDLLDSWTREMAQYIKREDPNHLVADGKDSYRYGLSENQIDNPYTDMLTEHYYWGDYLSSCHKSMDLCRKKKVFYVGEFNHADTSIHRKLFEEVIKNGTSGALVWSLRFHTKEGGFYYHNERTDASNPCYRWPGFPSASFTMEAIKMNQIRHYAYLIRSIPASAINPPGIPKLIAILSPSCIRWQGSTGAMEYCLERATDRNGSWEPIAQHVKEDAIPYIPYNDESAVHGKSYFYRIKAINNSGTSSYSAPFGPVQTP